MGFAWASHGLQLVSMGFIWASMGFTYCERQDCERHCVACIFI